MNNKEFAKRFNDIYKEIATTAIYSMELANKIGYGNGIKAIDMPKEMSEKVEEYGGGCCFHHSWRLIHKLTNSGITAYWAAVPEPDENNHNVLKCVVVYETPDNERYVADIIEDIKGEVKMEDFVPGSCRWVNSKGELVNNSKIDLQEMARISDTPIVPGYLKIYPKPNADISFDEFCEMEGCEIINMV